jgi:hypothetical protein
MSKSGLRTGIVILSLITAVIHLVVLNFLLGSIDIPFTLNGLGYLALLFVFLNPSLVPVGERLIHYAFIGFALVTIIAWFVLGDLTDPLGIATKIDEVILIFALWRHLHST